MELNDVEVRSPDGVQLVEPLDLRLDPGDSLVIIGRSGSGKTTLLRSLAQLWPFASGMWRRPDGDDDDDVLDAVAVCAAWRPAGRGVVSGWPRATSPTADSPTCWPKWHCAHLRGRLDEVQDWAKVLSPGEQQRVAFARVLLTKPRAVFLDEATSALDAGLEFSLYQLLRTELPDTIVVWYRSAIATPWNHITGGSWHYWMTGPGASGRSANSPRPCRAGLVRRY